MAITYRVNADVIPKETWVQDPEIGGGRIVGEVCHFVDTVSYLAGADPVSVYATCVKKDDQSIPDEDNVSIVLSYANGSTATIGYFAYGNRQVSKEYVELFSGNIAMQMNDFRELMIYRGDKKEKIKRMNQDKGFAEELKAFRDAVKTGVPAIPFESIVTTSRVSFKILESIRTGDRVTV